MQRRTLGGSALAVSAMGLGCMGMSEFYGPSDDLESRATLELAAELGMTFLDTADMYGHGDNERLVGEFLRGRRERFTVATKFGIVRPTRGKYERSVDNDPTYVSQACEASLRRLGVETIDLYYVHRVNQAQLIEDTVGAMADLVRQGKVRAVGLCEVSAATLRRAHAEHPIAAVQTEYSLWSREAEQEIIPTCRELGVGFVAYCPLGRGFLTGHIASTDELADNDFRRSAPRFQKENMSRNQSLLAEIIVIARSLNATPAQVSLAWLLARGDDIVPIPGTRRTTHLRENAGAADLRLTSGEIARLDSALPIGAAVGDRYTAEGMKGVNV